MRKKKCKSCEVVFQPERQLQQTCSVQCAIDLVNKKKKQKLDKEYREKKAKLKTRREWLKEAQQAFNSWIRYRDKDEPCISCQRHHKGQYHAGHYRSVGSCPELRFEELNNHKQCSMCNSHLSGNLIEYRKNLLVKIGKDKLEWLEGNHPSKHYSIEEIKDIRDRYRKMING